MPLSLVTPTAAEPILLAEALTHLRLEPDAADSAYVQTLIAPARGLAESLTSRQLITATWSITFDAFPSFGAPIPVPLPPLQSVSFVKYLDPAGTLQIWASNQYVVDAPQGPRALEGRVYPAAGVQYPTTIDRRDAVTVQFVAGYGAAGTAVPAALRQAMLLLIGHYYENREAVIVGTTPAVVPLAVDALLGPFTRFSQAVR